MAIETRVGMEDDVRTGLSVVHVAFGEAVRDDDVERERHLMPVDRVLIASDGDTPVGNAASYPFALTVPGGEVAAGGVTWVGVVPSHRRRGILNGLMQRQLHDLHEREEPLAILWASESAIYGRYGYGISAPAYSIDGERARFAYRGDPKPAGTVRLVDTDEATQVFPEIYEQLRPHVPGMLTRTEEWWRERHLADPENWRRGYGPKFYALLELDGAAAAYATYRVKSEWEQGIPNGRVRVIDTMATSPLATKELWRFLFGIDLIGRVEQWMFDPASPLFLTVKDPRSLHLQVYDGLWLRLVDAEAALRSRSYAAGDPVVIEVRDELCSWNAGRYRIDGGVERTGDDPDLELDVADLACAYLGGFDFHRLGATERVRELSPGALERATVLFRTARPPYCPEEF